VTQFRTRVLAVLLGALVCGGAGGVVSSQRTDSKATEDAILAVSAEMTKAGEAADADRLFSYMLDTDKGSVIQNGVFFATRQEALEQVKNALSRASGSKIQYRWKRQFVTVLSPDAALLTAEGEAAVTTASGETFSRPLAQTIVFVLKDGKWKALHAHQSAPPRQ
jgi:uncharacterized protein (TIGR02246 family)